MTASYQITFNHALADDFFLIPEQHPITYNLGGGALQGSTLCRKVNREEHAEVPAEFIRWVWAGGRKLKGLIRRREAEADLYNDFVTPPYGR